MGLASEVLPAAEVVPAATALAHEIATQTAPLSVAVVKRLLWQSPTPDRDATDRIETDLHRHVMSRADAREGPLAFLERRDPDWKLSPTEDWPDWPT